MLSFDEVKKNAQRRRVVQKTKNADWEEVKTRARNNTATSNKNATVEVGNWFKGISQIGSQYQKYYATEGYKEPNQAMLKDIDRFASQAGKIKSLMSASREKYADYDVMLQSYDEALGYLNNLKEDINNKNAHFAQFVPNKEQTAAGHTAESLYNEWFTDQTYRQKYGDKGYGELNEILAIMEDGEEKDWLSKYAQTVMTTADYETEISAADESLAVLEADLQRYNDAVKNLGAGSAVKEMIIQQTNDKYGGKSALEEHIDTLKNKKWTLENGKEYNFLSMNGDYSEQSQVAASDRTFNLSDPVSSLHYDLVNGFADHTSDEARESGNFVVASIKDIVEGNLAHLTPEEKNNYNYLYNTQGAESAEEYLKYLKNTLAERAQAYTAEEWSKLAHQFPVGTNILRVPMKLWSGVGYLDALGQKAINDIKEDMTGEYAGPVNYSGAAMTPAVVSTAISETTANNLAHKYGTIALDETEHPILSQLLNGKSWSDVYQLGMSMVDSTAVAAASPVLGPAGTLMLAGSAATQTMLDAVEKGATDEQALTMGALSGAFEYLFERYELESLLSNGSEGMIRALVNQGLSEGFGEGMTSVANLAADTIVMADISEINRAAAEYMKADPTLSEKEARKKAWMDQAIQIGWDVVGGVASGNIMGGGHAGIHTVARQHSYTKAGREILASGGVTGLQELAAGFGETDSNIAKIASQISDKTTGKNARQVGRLYGAVREAVGKQNRLDLANSLIQKGVSTEAAQKIADIVIEAQTNPENVTDAQADLLAALAQDKTIASTVNEVLNSESSAVYQRNAKLRQITAPTVQGTSSTASGLPSHQGEGFTGAVQNNSAEDRDATSLEGKTFLQSSGEEVQNVSYQSIDNGSVTVTVNGSTEAAAGDVSFGDEAISFAYSAVTGATSMTPAAANMILRNPKVSNTKFVAEALRAFQGGVRNDQNIASRLDANVISADEARALFDEGRKAAEKGSENVIDNSAPDEENSITQKSTRGEQYDNRGIREGAAEGTEASRLHGGTDSKNGTESYQGKEWRNRSDKVHKKAKQVVEEHISNSPNSTEVYYYLLNILEIDDSDMTVELYDEAVLQLTEDIYNDAVSMNPVLFENKWSFMGGSISGLRRSILNKVEGAESNKPAAKEVRKRGSVKGYDVDFNDIQSSAYRILRQIADVTGIDIVLFKSQKDVKGNLRGGIVEGIDMRNAQGAFSWHNDKIYIDVNAGVLTEAEMGDTAKYAMLRTFSHEFTHFIEKHNPEEYAEFRELVFETMRKNGHDPETMIDAYMQQDKRLDRDKASREVVAESMTDILPESSFVQELAERNRNLFQTLLDKLKAFVESIKAHFDSLGYNRSAEPQALKEQIDGVVQYTDDIVKMFDKIAVQAVENYQQAVKNTAQMDGGVQHQARRLKKSDLDAYLNAGSRRNINKVKAIENGQNIILTTEEEIADFIDKSIEKKAGDTAVAYGRVNNRLANEVYAESKGKITIDDYYLELIPTDLQHAYEQHSKGKMPGDIDLSREDFKKIPEYLDSFTEVLYAIKYNSGQTRICVSKKLANGRILIIETVSKSRGSIQLKNAIGVSEEKYTKEYLGVYKKRAGTNTGGSSSSNNTPRDITDSNESIRKSNGNVNNNSGQQNQKRTSTLTNRDVLAQLPEGVALNENERYYLQKYQKQLGKVREQEQIRAELTQEIEKLEPGQTEMLQQLQTELTKTRNRLDILSKNLKQTETAKPLDAILQREAPKILERLRKEYGTIPKGEKAVRDDALPVSTDGKNKVSRTARTVKGAAVTTDEFAGLVDTEVAKGELTYLPISNDETSKEAAAWVENLGWAAALAEWYKAVGEGKTGADMAARGAVLLNNAAQAGDRDTWREILFSYQQLGTRTAQGLQALRILKKLSPEDRLHMVRRSVKQMVKDMHLKTDVVLDEDLLKRYETAENEEQRDLLLGMIQQSVADQIPASIIEKFTALRYVNMLGNLRTQVRNFFGNVAMKTTSAFKNTIAASLENLVYYTGGQRLQRTRSISVNKDLLQQAKADYKSVEALLLDGGRYSAETADSSEFARQVKEKRTIFKNKLLEKYRTTTNAFTEQGDLLFSKAAYGRALAGYLQVQGVTDIAKADAELLDKARLFAVKEAQEQTFRDTNWLSGWVSKMGRRWDTPTAGMVIGEGVMPFRKTPANILVRAQEYSPLGLFNSLYISAQAMRKNSQVTGDQVINSWAKTLTGSVLFGLGMWLSAIGGLTGGPDDDDELESFERMYGIQNYAIVLPDGTNLTFDWVSPAAIPMLMGAQLMELCQEDGFQVSDLEAAFTSIMEPFIEMSMLQGVKDALDNVQYAENNLGQMVITFGLNYLTQVMTNSLLGQIERTFQDTRETTYVDKDSAVPGWLQRSLGTQFSKIPGVDYNQVPYINAWGEEEQNPNVLLNAIYNMLSPSYVDKAETDAVYDELVRLNAAQDEKNVLPNTPEKTYEGRDLTADEYVTLAKAQGQTQRELVEKLITSAGYKAMSDTDKAKAISFAYKYAKEKAQIDVLGRKEFSAKWLNEIKGDAAAAIIVHVKDK